MNYYFARGRFTGDDALSLFKENTRFSIGRVNLTVNNSLFSRLCVRKLKAMVKNYSTKDKCSEDKIGKNDLL